MRQNPCVESRSQQSEKVLKRLLLFPQTLKMAWQSIKLNPKKKEELKKGPFVYPQNLHFYEKRNLKETLTF